MDKKIVNMNEKRVKLGGKGMYIGGVLKERMSCFDMAEHQLCEEALIEADELQAILNDKLSFDAIDEVTISFISQVLYCNPEYFIDQQIRNNDIVNSSLNRGASTSKSNEIKGMLQRFSDDFSFLRQLKKELEGEV